MRRLAFPLLPLALAAAASGCGSSGARPSPPASSPARAAGIAGELADGGVAVSASMVPGPGETSDVRVRFAPRRPGFHLYSVNLPSGGVGGLGTPTIVTVGGGLRQTGKAVADRPVRTLRITELKVSLPVYPDGPVTVTVPVRRAGPGRPSVTVTYGACSTATCLPPVHGRAIPLS